MSQRQSKQQLVLRPQLSSALHLQKQRSSLQPRSNRVCRCSRFRLKLHRQLSRLLCCQRLPRLKATIQQLRLPALMFALQLGA